MPVDNQATQAPYQSPVDPSIAALLSMIQGKNQSIVSSSGTQNSNGMTGNMSGGMVPATQAASVPIAQPQPNAQSPQWQTAPAQPGREAQKRADMGALVNNIQGLVKTAAQNQNAKNIRTATNDWNRLMTAMQQPNDPNNQKIIQDILGDPKKLKQMSKALDIDWLNPAKGADNVYRQSLGQAIQQQQNKQGALQALKTLLSGGAQNKTANNVQLNPDQQKQLAAQMQARFPTQATDPTQLKNQLTSQVYQKALKNGLSSLSPEEQEVLGIGASANAQLKAATDLQLQQMKAQLDQEKIDAKNEQFASTMNERIAEREQKFTQFQQSQAQLLAIAKQNYTLKQADLQVKLRNAATASDRLSIQQQIADTQRGQLNLKSYSDQISTYDKQIQVLTAQEKAVITANTTQTSGIFGSDKTKSLTDEGQAKVTEIEDQIKDLQTKQVDLYKRQTDYITKLNSSENGDPLSINQ